MVNETQETPVLDTIASMTLESLDRCRLDQNTQILVRLAALVAVDAKPVSYLAHVGPAVGVGVSLEQIEDVLVAVAPIVGTPRVVSASIGMAEALDVAIAVAESER